MDYTILPMTTAHLDQVEEIEKLCFSDPWSKQMLEEHLKNPCAATLAAVAEDGSVLGYIGLLLVLDEGSITNVAVAPAHRRQGVASSLLGAARDLARSGHAAFLTLEVRASNTAAQNLYAKHGYTIRGRRKNYYLHPREDAIIMTLELENCL